MGIRRSWPALLVCLSGIGPSVAAAADDQRLMALADDYINHFYYPQQPSVATTDGRHEFDSQLEQFSPAAVAARVTALTDYERRIAAINPNALSEQVAGDRALLLGNIRSWRLSLQTIRYWQIDADFYSSTAVNGAFTVMERDYASLDERLKNVIAREQQIPALLQMAHVNLHDPAKVFTQIAIEQLPGDISFFRDDLPAAFAAAQDPLLQAQFRGANERVIQTLKDYQGWLTRDLLPRSHGDFRLGTRTFRAKLEYDEMVDIPLPRLLAIGVADLKRNQAQFKHVAQIYEPGKNARDVLTDLQTDHPPADQLLQSMRDCFGSVTAFLNTHPIITVPAGAAPMVLETPPFMRATTFASMDTPGPFERSATDAHFFVTLPDPSWDAARIEDFMQGMDYAVISNTVVHEAYPGHYIQFLWNHQLTDVVREVLGANSNVEGWAHYSEQMMLDEGYRQPGAGARDARDAARYRLGQLQDALLRDARYVVAIQLHTGHMSLEQAQRFFVEQGYQAAEVAEAETKRGTGDPTYLYYTLGKLQIMKLRADLQAREGKRFNLKAFHDDFMRQGHPPLRLVRRALLHDDSPTL